jgi:hypothetical protein
LSRAGANVGDLLVARAGSDSDGSVRRAAVVLLAAAEGPG